MTKTKRPETLEQAIQERSEAEKIIEQANVMIHAQAKKYVLMALNMSTDEYFSPDELAKIITTKLGIQFKTEDVRSAASELHHNGKITREPGLEEKYKVWGCY